MEQLAETLRAEPVDRPAAHLRHAVTDGPDGSRFVRLSGERAQALRIRASHPQGFHCGRQLGGCGAQLILAAGEVNAAYFRHRAGAAAECPLDRDPSRAERELTHLLLQRELLDWLVRQGLRAQIEKLLPGGGRADLHIVVAARQQTIEVQLSPLTHDHWVARRALYRAQVDRVHWLYGPGVAGGLAEEEMEASGWSLLIRWTERTTTVGTPSMAVEIGTHARAWTRWSALRECRLTEDGFLTPHTEEAAEQHARHLAEREARRRAAEEAAQARAREQEPQPKRRPAGPVTPIPPRRSGPLLADFLRWTPGFDAWQSAQDWDWMAAVTSPQIRTALMAAVFKIEHGTINGPIECLIFRDAPDEGLTEDLLVQAGLIRVFDHRGVGRWERI